MPILTIQMGFEGFECTIWTGFEPLKCKVEPFGRDLKLSNENSKHLVENLNHSSGIWTIQIQIWTIQKQIRIIQTWFNVSFCYIGWQCVRRPWLSTWRPKGWPFLGSTLYLLLTSSISSPKETSPLRCVTVSHLHTMYFRYTYKTVPLLLNSTCYKYMASSSCTCSSLISWPSHCPVFNSPAFKASKPCY